MSGHSAVHSLKTRLAATFDRAKGIQGDPELLSDFARYLCVLLSGYLEQAIIELTLEHVRRRSNASVQKYVEARLRGFTNANSRRILNLLASFDSDWRIDMEAYLVDELKDAVDSVVNNRNAIAHGRYSGLTISRVSDYHRRVDRVIDHIAQLVAP